jgi:protein TonB
VDAVGNILAERQQERFPIGGGVSLALLLHAVVAAGLLASALARPMRFVAPRAVSVRLMSAGALQGGAAVAVPAQPVREPEPQKPKIEKAEEPPPAPSSKAVLLPAKKKDPDPPAPAARTAEVKKNEPSKAAPAGTPRGTSAGPTINASSAGVGIGGARLDQADFQYAYYIERMIIAVGTNWFKPAQVVPVEPVVRFQVERDGTVTDPEIEVSSGLPFVDRAALRAVMAASPLPPLPPEYTGSRLGVHLIFEK